MNAQNENPGTMWVEPVGGMIIARIRGIATADLIQECQKRVMELQSDTGCKRVMYDALELERPPLQTVLAPSGAHTCAEIHRRQSRDRSTQHRDRLPLSTRLWRSQPSRLLQ
jgi:hypothetical protein